MNERIKLIRLELRLNQSEFGEKIGLGQAGVSAIEKGIRSITDRNIQIICEKFNVSEEWLRTGNGEMFNPYDEDSELEYMIGVLGAENDKIKTKLITFMLKQMQDEKRWKIIKEMLIDFNKMIDESLE